MTSSPLLTIAGFDPSSGAGVTADLAVFAAHGFFGTSAISALTVQSTVGVQEVRPVDADWLRATLDCLEGDVPPVGIKVGMLATADNVHEVAAYLERKRTRGSRVPVVLDPVMLSTSGGELLSQDGVAALLGRLLPLVDWVTPNRAELARLTRRWENAEAGARELQANFPQLGVVVTGGDGDRADDFVANPVGEQCWLRGDHLESRATHGTGCAFSSALLCALVAGDGRGEIEAARMAKHFVTEAIRTAVPVGSGRGPMNLLWPVRLRTGDL